MNTSGGIFLPDGENLRRSDFDHSKTAFCEYWKSIKINNSVTCVSKEHVIKTKLVQEQCLQLKMTFLFFYCVELTFGGQGIKVWWVRRRGNEQVLGWWGRLTYIIGQSDHLTSAIFEHFVCQRYIWYMFSLVCSVLVIK